MKTLDQIGIAHGTDKASEFTRTYAKPHDYLRHMDRLFTEMRFEPIKLLEIGVGGGESIRTWLEYFTHEGTQIRGIDLVEKTNPWNTPGESPDKRYQFLQGNQSDQIMWKCAIANWGRDFDIVIDDGSHEPKDIIETYMALWPCLVRGGYYCIEDLGCGFTSPGYPSHYEWLNAMVSGINTWRKEIDSITFSRELAILRKS